jgi:hypothetical protein
MKLTNYRLSLFGLVTLTSSVFAQYAPPPPARPFPGFANERLRADNVYMNAWDVAVNYRVR